MGIQAAEALEHAHGMGVVHRDIKPSNLMVESRLPSPSGRGAGGEGPHLWITDFGLAMTQTDANLTMTGDVLGTLRYMSPEQVQAKHGVLDHRTDVYSLGVTLYELLTLQPAFPGDRQTLMGQIAEEDPRPPRQLNHAIPKDLETIMLKTIAKKPEARYATAKELADDLKRFLEDKPIEARRPSPVERARKWARRHRPVVWSAAALLVFAVAALAPSTVLIAKAYEGEKAQRQAAQENAKKAETEQQKAQQQREVAVRGREEATRQRNVAQRNLYLAHMRLVQHDWEAGQIGRLHQMLDAHLPKPGEPDLRNWEWYYFLGKCHSELATYRGHIKASCWVAWSPDGKYIASADGTVFGVGAVKIWEVATHKELVSFDTAARSLAWSADGKRLATGGWRGVQIWDVASGKKLLSIDPDRSVLKISLSPDGKRLAGAARHPTAKKHGIIVIWDAKTGEKLLEIAAHGGYTATTVAFSPDGQRVASGGAGQDMVVKVWDANTGKELLSLGGHEGNVSFVAWSPDGKYLASASNDKSVRIWETSKGELLATLLGHTGRVHSVAWSPDGGRLASGGGDQMIKIWDPKTGHEVRTLRGHTQGVVEVAFSPDGKQLASGAGGGVKLWQVEEVAEPPLIRVRPQATSREYRPNSPTKLAYSPDGRRIAVGCYGPHYGPPEGGTFKIFDVATGEQVLTLRGHVGNVRSAVFSPDGERVASTGVHDETLRIWDANTGKLLRTIEGHKGPVWDAAWSPGGKRVVSSSLKVIKIWDSETGREVLASEVHRSHIWEVSWSPDGTRLATCGNHAARILDAANGKEICLLPGPDGRYRSGTWSPDGKYLAAALGHTVYIWDGTSGKRVRSLIGHAGELYAVAWSPDGTRLASGGADETIKIWDAASWQEILTLREQKALHFSVAWSPRGRQLASFSKMLIHLTQAATICSPLRVSVTRPT